jgi:hypothetical protein
VRANAGENATLPHGENRDFNERSQSRDLAQDGDFAADVKRMTT